MNGELVTFELWRKVGEKEMRVASGLGSHDSAEGYKNEYIVDGVEVFIVEVTETRRVVGQ